MSRYASGTTPRANDTQRILEEKILDAIANLTAAPISGVTGVYASNVNPNGVINAPGIGWCVGTGALDGFYWKQTNPAGGTVWTPV